MLQGESGGSPIWAVPIIGPSYFPETGYVRLPLVKGRRDELKTTPGYRETTCASFPQNQILQRCSAA
jgi:hypothetical protein